MNLLAIDTANEYLSLGVSNSKQEFFYCEKIGNRQSEHIIPQIKQILDDAQLELKDIELIAYNQGPGSFTGLRIGLSVALALAYSIQCPLLPVPMFTLYSSTATQHKPNLIVTLDARLGQIYVAAFNQASLAYLIEPQLVNPEDLTLLISQNVSLTPEKSIITGGGMIAYKNKISHELYEDYEYFEQNYPSTQQMLTAAKSGILNPCSVFDADLLYVRNKVAMNIDEQQLNKANKQNAATSRS
jgi:tRNA threonylcarbamoyladenosine biosynthesis protein TsaB